MLQFWQLSEYICPFLASPDGLCLHIGDQHCDRIRDAQEVTEPIKAEHDDVVIGAGIVGAYTANTS